MRREAEIRARKILESLLSRPLSHCCPIERSFSSLSAEPGIYAVRHRTEGLLYVGKTQDFKERFRGGHKALTWVWIADYDYRDVWIATYALDFQEWRALSSELEGLILRISEPPHNARIPTRD